MAHFIGGVKGRRAAEVTRLGDKNSGITAYAQGWHCGVIIRGRYNAELGVDEFYIYETDGSSNPLNQRYIMTVREKVKVKEPLSPLFSNGQ